MSLMSIEPDDLTWPPERASIGPEAGPETVKLVAAVLERTLLRLLGPVAPQEALLEKALLEALETWPADHRSLLLWGQRLAVRVALEHLKQAESPSLEEWRTTRPGRAREVFAHLQVWLRQSRPDEQLAFTLLELNGSSLCEAATLLGAPTDGVRQRAARVRRKLLFAARRDLWLTRYLLIAPRLRALLRCWDRATLHAPPSERTRRISDALELEITWFA